MSLGYSNKDPNEIVDFSEVIEKTNSSPNTKYIMRA